MADKYLIRCHCGQEVAASANQAGSQVACQCGAMVEVPPLRKLKHLPRKRETPVPAASGWSGRQAVLMAGAVVTACLLAWAGWLWATQPVALEFDPTYFSDNVDRALAESSPRDLWIRWEIDYQTLADRGFSEMSDPRKEAIDAYIAQRQLFRNVVLGIAAVVVITTVAGWALWPPPRR